MAYGRGLIQGVMSWAVANRGWETYLATGHGDLPPDFQRWRFDGLIVRALKPEVADAANAAIAAGVPAVVFWGRHEITIRTPTVTGPRTDGGAVGRLAARHFLDLGHQAFGFVGWSRSHNESRLIGYLDELKKAGHHCHSYFPDPPVLLDHTTPKDEAGMDAWLTSLPRPIGLFASNDTRGIHVVDACRRVGLRCPEDVAVLGVDNDELLCQASFPPLSSIELDVRAIGWEAAEMLDELMQGQGLSRLPGPHPPRRLVSRQSSDLVAIADPIVASAIAFIREHVDRQISVGDLLDHVPASRSSLERRFKKAVSTTPSRFIRRAHIDHAKQLLRETDMTLEAVASRSGYPNAVRFSEAFRAETGKPPSVFRQQHTEPPAASD